MGCALPKLLLFDVAPKGNCIAPENGLILSRASDLPGRINHETLQPHVATPEHQKSPKKLKNFRKTRGGLLAGGGGGGSDSQPTPTTTTSNNIPPLETAAELKANDDHGQTESTNAATENGSRSLNRTKIRSRVMDSPKNVSAGRFEGVSEEEGEAGGRNDDVSASINGSPRKPRKSRRSKLLSKSPKRAGPKVLTNHEGQASKSKVMNACYRRPVLTAGKSLKPTQPPLGGGKSDTGGGGTHSVGCSCLRWVAPGPSVGCSCHYISEMKLKSGKRATLRHNMVNLLSFLLHKLFLVYMSKY